MTQAQQEIEGLLDKKYEAGFVTDIETETAPPGLDEDTSG